MCFKPPSICMLYQYMLTIISSNIFLLTQYQKEDKNLFQINNLFTCNLCHDGLT